MCYFVYISLLVRDSLSTEFRTFEICLSAIARVKCERWVFDCDIFNWLSHANRRNEMSSIDRNVKSRTSHHTLNQNLNRNSTTQRPHLKWIEIVCVYVCCVNDRNSKGLKLLRAIRKTTYRMYMPSYMYVSAFRIPLTYSPLAIHRSIAISIPAILILNSISILWEKEK